MMWYVHGKGVLGAEVVATNLEDSRADKANVVLVVLIS